MRFQVLGPLEVSGPDGPLILGGPKQRAVLAHLLVRANTVVPVDALIDQLWADRPPESAKNTLQTYISHLRKVLGPDRLEGHSSGYVLHVGPSELDAQRFEQLVSEARAADGQPDRVGALLREALALWHGSAFADVSAEGSLAGEIARLNEFRLTALEDRIGADLASGLHGEVIGELEGLTKEHPLRERLRGHHMLALYRMGRQADALAAFQRARELLADDLGVDPSPGLQRLHEGILRHDADLELKGRPLRGYRLLEQIGEGAFGLVYRAIQPQVGREVAVKSIHPELANQPDFVRRFEREAQFVARLEHPHIVPLYDYWREPDGAYLVMRFLRGGNLEDLLAQGPLEVGRAAAIIDQISGALAVAHRQGVVHRDVKPGNVLLDEEGNAYLSDFGVALETGAPDQTSGTMVRGTPAYLSPEQIRLEPTSPRSDIYALGVVLFEMLTGQHPYPESSLTALLDQHMNQPIPSARALRPELPPGVDAVLARATAKDPGARFAGAPELSAAFRGVIEGPGARLLPIGEVRNPFKGLRAFLEADAADFFGREVLTRRLIERLAEPRSDARFLCVVGPSGSGKSSLVRAGLVPALRRGAIDGSERWFVVEMLPGPHPLRELESALLAVAVSPPPSLLEVLESDGLGLAHAVDKILPDPSSELVIVIDQLEEMFTLVDDDAERAQVLELVRAATQDTLSRVRVIATLRADFFDQPLSVRGFGDLLAARTEAITPMSPHELERAIAGPAERVGVEFEPALLAQVIADAVRRAGSLPLLQYALTELFEHRSEGLLTLAEYERMGGLGGALARRAEHIYGSRHDGGREAVRQLFLRLVSVDHDMDDVRRRVPRSELGSIEVDHDAMDGALEAFGRARLLTFDRDPATREPTVEVAHESLLRQWPRLRGWLEEAGDDMRLHRRLASASAEWIAGGRDTGLLARGGWLAQVGSWSLGTSFALTSTEHEYLDMSIAERDREAKAEMERDAYEARIERRAFVRLRALVAVLTIAAVLATGLSIYAFGQRSRAQRASRLSLGRELAAAAQANETTDQNLAILLALRSVETTQGDGIVVPQADEVLRDVVPVSSVRSLGEFGDVAMTPDLARVAIVGDAGATGVWDLRTGARILTLPSADQRCPPWFPGCRDVDHVALSPDGALLATSHGDGTVRVWDVTSGRLLQTLKSYAATTGAWRHYSPLSTASSVDFTADGRSLVAGGYGGTTVWNVVTGDVVLKVPRTFPPVASAVSQDGSFLAVVGRLGVGFSSRSAVGTEVRAIATGTTVFQAPSLYSTEPALPALSSDGTLLAVATAGAVRVESVSGAQATSLFGGKDSGAVTHQASLTFMELGFAPVGPELAAAASDGTVRIWDGRSDTQRTIGGHVGPANAIAWSPDGRLIASGGATDGVVLIQDVTSGRTIATLRGSEGSIVALQFSPDASQLAVASSDGLVVLRDVSLPDQIALARSRLTRGFTADECRRYLHLTACPFPG